MCDVKKYHSLLVTIIRYSTRHLVLKNSGSFPQPSEFEISIYKMSGTMIIRAKLLLLTH